MKKIIGFSGLFAASVFSLALIFAVVPAAHAQTAVAACPSGYTCSPVTRGSNDYRTPSITVVSPSTGDVLYPGTQIPITWNTNGLPASQKMNIILNVGSGGTGKVIASDVPNTGYYRWTVEPLQPWYASESGTTIHPTGQYNIYVSCNYGDANCNFNPNFGQSGVFTIASSTSPVNPPGSCYTWSAYLGIGSTGADVVALQVWLKDEGFGNLPSTGYFGTQTAAAVQKLQAAINIPATGYVGALTIAYLNQHACGTPPSPVCPAGFVCGKTASTTASIAAALDPSSPVTSIVQISPTAQTNDVPLAVFDIESQGGASTLRALQLNLNIQTNPTNQSPIQALFSNVSIKVGGQTYSGSSISDLAMAFSNLTIALPANQYVPVTVLGVVNQDANDSLDGSSATVSLPTGDIQAYDSSNNPLGVTTGTISGSTITFTSNGPITITPVSVGQPTYTLTTQPDVQGYTSATYPFTFTVAAGNTPVFISATPSSAVTLNTTLSGVPGVSGDAENTIPIAIIAVSAIPGDTNTGLGINATGSFYVPANSSRTFTVNAIVNNEGNATTVNNAIVQIAGIYYSSNPTPSGSITNTSSESLYTSGLTSLQSPAVSLLGNCPAGYVCTSTPTTTPSITVTSPSAGQSFSPGQQVQISYSAANFPRAINVAIQLNKGAAYPSGPYNPVSNSDVNGGYTPATGNYNWTVPSGLAQGNDYSLLVSPDYPNTETPATIGWSGNFTITSANQPPVINGGTFPTTLAVGQTGTWSINASDPQNGSLSYSVNWGDVSNCPVGYTCSAPAATPSVTQTSTFTHSYANPGTYTVTFTVTDSAGLSAQTSATVTVTSSTPVNNGPQITAGGVGSLVSCTPTTQLNVQGCTADTFPFTFTVAAGNTPVFISATPSSAITAQGTPGPTVTPVSISAVSAIPGDTNTGLGINATGSFYVPANSSRTFTVDVTENNINNAFAVSDAIIQITGIYYSSNPTPSGSITNTSSESLYTSGLTSLQSPAVSLLGNSSAPHSSSDYVSVAPISGSSLTADIWDAIRDYFAGQPQ